MKRSLYYFLLLSLFACNNEKSGSSSKSDSASTEKKQSAELPTNTASGCGNAILFHEGLIMESKTYNAAGAVTRQSVASVTKVFDEGGVTVAQMASKTSNADGSDEKATTTTYRCNGQNIQMDLNSLLGDNKNMTIEGSGFSFPLNIAEGQTLPDVNYSISMDRNGKTVKINSSMKDRKVIGKESVTIPGGTFECYKIASVVEASTEIEDMDEKTKKMMDAMKDKMPKTSMVLWYAPEATVMKVEMYQGDKLVSHTDVTAIKK